MMRKYSLIIEGERCLSSFLHALAAESVIENARGRRRHVSQQWQVMRYRRWFARLQQDPYSTSDGADQFQPFTFPGVVDDIQRVFSCRGQPPAQNRQIVRAPGIQDSCRQSASVGKWSVRHQIASIYSSDNPAKVLLHHPQLNTGPIRSANIHFLRRLLKIRR